jgi:pterin-4a-carbinolamine dehydratase
MEELTNQQKVGADLTDWRKLAQRLHARFGVDDFASGVAFLVDVRHVAQRLGHFPEARLTHDWVELARSRRQQGLCLHDRGPLIGAFFPLRGRAKAAIQSPAASELAARPISEPGQDTAARIGPNCAARQRNWRVLRPNRWGLT